MKLIVYTFLILLIGNCLFTQNEATISGRIFEKETTKPIPFVTVLLNTSEEDVMIAGTLSDENGRFTIAGIKQGKYVVVCSFVGFLKYEIPVLVGEKNNSYDLGSIELVVESTQLDEIMVIAKKAVVDAGLDKKSFAMDEQFAQSGGSVLDAMKALPGVAVDQEGNILLRGSNQVAVLIDGQQSGMTGFGHQQGLGNIPAANIESIEIINNPSAKYDANGMAGIINIIYKKEKESGLHGEIGFTYGLGELTNRKADLPTSLGRYKVNPKYIPNISLNFRSATIHTYLQSEIIQQKKLPNNEFTTRSYKDGTRTISAVPENRTQTHYIVKGGIDWKLSEGNTLGLSSIWDYESHIDTAQIPYINLLNNQRYRYWHWKEDEVTGYLNFRLNYKHDFPEPGHELNAAAQYVRGWEDESYFLNDSSEFRQSTDDTHIIAIEHTTSFNIDYVKPLRSGRIELGSKLQIRAIPVTYDVVRGQQSIIYEGIGDWSDWGENIYSAYLNYVLEKEKFDLEGGIRGEQTAVKYDISSENTYYPENDAYNYFRFYPNIRLTFKLSTKNNLSLFYNKRVDRPGEPNLRIFPKYDDPELLKVGNPYVRPQFTQTIEAAYKRIWETGSIFLATYYRKINDPFLRIYNIDNSNANYSIINKIYQNVGSGSNLGIEVLLAQNVGKFWKTTGSFNWYNNTIDAFSGVLLFPYQRSFQIENTEDQTWDIKLNNQIRLPANTEIQLTAIYLAPKNIPQGKQLSRSSIDLGIKNRILQNNGEIIFSITDIFNDFGIREELSTEEFDTVYENYFETQVLRLGFKYKW